MAIMDSLKKGMQLTVTFVGLFISFYALLFIGLLVIGVIANTALSGDINVSGTSDTTPNNDSVNESSGTFKTIEDTETNFNSAVSTLQNPVTIIISLLVVGVLMAMFFPQGFSGATSGKKGKGGVL